MTRPVGTSVAEKLIGRTMDGKYRIDAFIGRGAMGLVFRATQLDVDKCVALKIMRSDVMADETALQRFYREARATSKLNHPNTIKVFESGQFSEGYPYIAMEFLDGEPLHKVIADEGSVPAQRVVKIVLQVVKALAEAHKENIVHRDLKPGNIMVLQLYGEHDFVKVLDFGIAKILTDTTSQQLTQAGFALGTPHYMSPEQAKGRPLDARSDLYSLGVIMFEMLTGQVPFKGESSVDVIMKHISSPVPRLHVDPTRYPYTARLVPIIERMLEKDRERRVQSSLELVRALEPLHVEGERMTLEGRVERVPRDVLLGEGPGAAAAAGGAAPDADDEPAVKTMALNADDLAGLGLELPERPAPARPQAPAPVRPSSPPAAPEFADDLGQKTMALSADDVASVASLMPPSRPAPAAPPAPPRSVTAAAFQARPAAVPSSDDASEKTMALNAVDVLALSKAAGAAPEGPESGEATQLFDAISADLSFTPSAPAPSAPAPRPAAPVAPAGEAAERTMLFDQLDASLLAPTPAPAPRPVTASTRLPSSVAVRRMTTPPQEEVGHEDSTMMFDGGQSADEAVSQDGSTMMFDANAYLNFQNQAPTADQESSTVMIDAASLGLVGPAINQDGSTLMVDAAAAQDLIARATGAPAPRPAARPPAGGREEGTLMIGDNGASLDTGSRRAAGTNPGFGTHPGGTTATGLTGGGSRGGWVVWALIGVGSVAIGVAIYFILQG